MNAQSSPSHDHSGDTNSLRIQWSRWVKLALLLVVVFVSGRWLESLGRLPASELPMESNPVLWPKLKKKICPNSLPDISLGPTLFELGRIELGLAANSTSARDPRIVTRNKQAIMKFFFDEIYRVTMFMDGSDPKNTVIYAPIKKAGHTQINSYLHRVFNRRKDGTVLEPSSPIGHPNDTYLEMLKSNDLKSLFYKTLERQSKNDSTKEKRDGSNFKTINATGMAAASKSDHIYLNQDESYYFTFNDTARTKPCVFTVLRDPISHFLSGYNEIEYRVISGVKDPGVVPNISDPEEAKRLALYTKIPFDGGSEQREKRFTTFVRNLLTEHPSFAHYGTYTHMACMSRILRTLSRFSLLPTTNINNPSIATKVVKTNNNWFLPTIKNLTEIFPRFLAERCPRMAWNYHQQESMQRDITIESTTIKDINHDFPTLLPPMDRQSGHKSSGDPYGTYMAAKTVFQKGGGVARALCVLHVMDYACYYDWPFIPKVCQEVYASKNFSSRILLAE